MRVDRWLIVVPFGIWWASIYLVQIDSGKTVRVTLPNNTRDAEHRIGRDEAVHLSWHGSSPVVLTE